MPLWGLGPGQSLLRLLRLTFEIKLNIFWLVKREDRSPLFTQGKVRRCWSNSKWVKCEDVTVKIHYYSVFSVIFALYPDPTLHWYNDHRWRCLPGPPLMTFQWTVQGCFGLERLCSRYVEQKMSRSVFWW
jgi:hypothetical protein